MNIAIIGAGNVGQALGGGWGKSGHKIIYGVRNPLDAKWGELRKGQPLAEVTTNAGAAQGAVVVVLSTPWDAAEEAVRACGSLDGKIVIDATNPLKPDFSGLDRGFETSGAEQVSAWVPGARVFKAMNQVGYGLMDHPGFPGSAKPVMFVAGSGPEKTKVLGLVDELGFEAVDAGDLTKARLLEPLAMLWIHLALVQGQGRDFAFSMLRRQPSA